MKKLISVLILLIVAGCYAPAFATVADNDGRDQYSCNGILTDYSYTFSNYSSDEVTVVVTDTDANETTLTETTDYTTSCTNNDCGSGGTVTLVAAATCASGQTITILRDTTISQESDYVDGMPALYEIFEQDLDKRTRVEQMLEEELNRLVKQPISFEGTDVTLPEPGASQFIRWNAAGTGLETATIGDAGTIVVLDEDDFVSDSNTNPPSQQSTGAYVRSGTYTMTNKTFTGATISGSTINNDVTGDLTGNVTGDLTGNVTGDLTGGIVETGSGGEILNVKIIAITNWNMDNNATWVVSGLGTFTEKIQSISAKIRLDASELYKPLDSVPLDGTAVANGGVVNFASGTISLARLTGGEFDHTNYSGTGDRGYMIIWYID